MKAPSIAVCFICVSEIGETSTTVKYWQADINISDKMLTSLKEREGSSYAVPRQSICHCYADYLSGAFSTRVSFLVSGGTSSFKLVMVSLHASFISKRHVSRVWPKSGTLCKTFLHDLTLIHFPALCLVLAAVWIIQEMIVVRREGMLQTNN